MLRLGWLRIDGLCLMLFVCGCCGLCWLLIVVFLFGYAVYCLAGCLIVLIASFLLFCVVLDCRFVCYFWLFIYCAMGFFGIVSLWRVVWCCMFVCGLSVFDFGGFG